MLELFRSRGISKPDTLTPREFIRRIPAPHVMLRPTAAELTGLYYRVRFAGIPLSDQEVNRVSELLQDLRSGLSSLT
jgi:Domain of unknown function (DUF4129)